MPCHDICWPQGNDDKLVIFKSQLKSESTNTQDGNRKQEQIILKGAKTDSGGRKIKWLDVKAQRVS